MPSTPNHVRPKRPHLLQFPLPFCVLQNILLLPIIIIIIIKFRKRRKLCILHCVQVSKPFLLGHLSTIRWETGMVIRYTVDELGEMSPNVI